MRTGSGVTQASRSTLRMVCGIAAIVALSLPSVAVAQYGRDRDSRGGPFTRLEPGIAIAVRTTDAIDARDSDYRVFRGVVDRDVRGDKRRVAIPRGSVVELIVRRLRNNDLSLDLESVTVNGQRYATETDPNLIAGTRGDDSLVGAIVGAIKGGEVRGRTVRVPRGTTMVFRLDRPLVMGIPDRGVSRDGGHYHDNDGRGDNGNRDIDRGR